MPASMPTVSQVDDLPVLMEKVVPPEWQDLNGHVNVRHYLELYDAASWPKLAWPSSKRNGALNEVP